MWRRSTSSADGNKLKDEQPRELDALESLRGFALPIIRELAALPRDADWDRWLAPAAASPAWRIPGAHQLPDRRRRPESNPPPPSSVSPLRFVRRGDPGKKWLGGRPDRADAHDMLGTALAMTGRTAEAIAEYEAALRLRPADAAARFHLANATPLSGSSGWRKPIPSLSLW